MHLATLQSMNNLAALYWSTMQLGRSVLLFEEVLKRRQAQLGPDHPDTLTTMANLGVNYRDARRLPEGTALLERAWAMARKRPGAPAVFILTALAERYDHAGQFAKAEPLYRAALAEEVKRRGEGSLPAASALDPLGRHLLKWHKCAEAEPLLRQCLKVRERHEPNDWETFNTKSLHGASLLGQKNLTEAEPLLLAGYEGMKQREAKVPPVAMARLVESIERLVQFYEATGRPEKAAEWKARLGRTDMPADVFARPSAGHSARDDSH
jgi:hypothetical protein